MKKQTVLMGGIVVIIVAIIAWQLVGSGSTGISTTDQLSVAPDDDPLDVTMELYNPWLDGLQATSTEFNKTELLDGAPLTQELRAKIKQLVEESQSPVDPVICQLELPERIGAKSVFVTDTESQVMVVARGKKVPEQALVSLIAVDGEWVISDIACSRGELAPDVEFTFEREGNLLKQSLQPPLNNEQWHLIYTRDGVAGNAIPVLFDANSTCVMTDGSEQVCAPDQLTEATAVLLQGAMQEAGVLVERMQLQ
jgi:hypothetical protein